MIPPFPFRRDILVPDDYLLFFFPSDFNFDFSHIAIPLTFTFNDHDNLLPALMPPQKKNRKEVV